MVRSDCASDVGCNNLFSGHRLAQEHSSYNLGMPDHRIIQGDSRKISEICPDLVGQISLVVTSPPYHNAISYEGHAANPTMNYRPRQYVDYAGEYMTLLNDVWHQCHQMLKDGGVLAINVGTVLENGYQFPLPMDIEREVLTSDDPWHYFGTIQWNKVTAGVKRAGSVIQQQLPGYWYPNIMTEHIMLFAKSSITKVTINQLSPFNRPWWDIAPVPPGQVAHPAPFPEDIPHRLMKLFTQPNDWVLDPFNGAGATTKAAYDLDRRGVGFDLEPRYVDFASRRLQNASSVRTSQLEIVAEVAASFVPGASRGKTRHGAGISTKVKK
jgi:DNA modification methylase